MSKRNDSVYLQDILESIDAIVSYIGDSTQFEYSRNMMMQDAVNRRFEIIGVAASSISNNFKSKYPDVPWQLMKDMRNKLAHEYFGISDQTIYRTIKIDLPVLYKQLLKIRRQKL